MASNNEDRVTKMREDTMTLLEGRDERSLGGRCWCHPTCHCRQTCAVAVAGVDCACACLFNNAVSKCFAQEGTEAPVSAKDPKGTEDLQGADGSRGTEPPLTPTPLPGHMKAPSNDRHGRHLMPAQSNRSVTAMMEEVNEWLEEGTSSPRQASLTTRPGPSRPSPRQRAHTYEEPSQQHGAPPRSSLNDRMWPTQTSAEGTWSVGPDEFFRMLPETPKFPKGRAGEETPGRSGKS